MADILHIQDARETANRAPIANVIEGIAKYRDEVRRYAEGFVAPLRKNYPNPHILRAVMIDDPYWSECRAWSERLRGMADLLGLTDEDIVLIDREFGVELPAS